MSSFFLKWSPRVTILVLLASCSQPTKDWVETSGTSEAGYSIQMPVGNDRQTGTIDLAGHEVTTHIAIAIDTGITFLATHFALPAPLQQLEAADRTDRVWELFMERLNARAANEGAPLAADPVSRRSGWFIDPDSVRLGVVLHVKDDLGIIVTSSTPEHAFGAHQREKMQRFFNSFEVH